MVKENMHIHSCFSWDSSLSLYDINRILLNGNIEIACITDHIEFDRESVQEVIAKFSIRNLRIDEINRINKMNGNKLVLLKGAEIGSPYKYIEQCKFLELLDLDFVMGSEHDIKKGIEEEQEIKEEYYRYYDNILKNIETGLVDCIGHIDYINRYYNNNYYLEEQFKEIFQAIKEHNQIIEVNSSAKRRIKICTFPDYEKLKIYKEYQDYITIGSDAHKKNEILDGIEEVYSISEELKLSPVYYQKRKRIKL